MRGSHTQNLHRTQDLHIKILLKGWGDQLKQQAGSMSYYSLYGEIVIEATDPVLMRESSILSKAGVDNVRFSFLRS